MSWAIKFFLFCVLMHLGTAAYGQPRLLGFTPGRSVYVPTFPNLKTFQALGGDVENSSVVFEGFYKGSCCKQRLAPNYISVVDDQSRASYVNVLSSKMAEYSDLESVILYSSLSGRLDVGNSPISIYNYNKDSGIDPSVLDYSKKEDFAEYVKWDTWKSDKVSLFVDNLVGRIEHRNQVRVIALGSVDWLERTVWNINRPTSLNNWPAWAKAGLIDEVILEGNWDRPESKQLLAQAREALAGTKVKMSVALDLRRDGKAIDPLGQLLNLQGERIDGIVVKVEDEADLSRAQKFVDEVLPEFAFGLGLQDAAPAPKQDVNATL